MFVVKLRRIGRSLGLVLPKEALEHLRAAEGDKLFVNEGPDNALSLSATNPELGKTMAVFESLNNRYSAGLRKLAK